jgi:hypothetical protein
MDVLPLMALANTGEIPNIGRSGNDVKAGSSREGPSASVHGVPTVAIMDSPGAWPGRNTDPADGVRVGAHAVYNGFEEVDHVPSHGGRR